MNDGRGIEYHAIIAFFAMPDNRAEGAIPELIHDVYSSENDTYLCIYSFNTAQNWKSGNEVAFFPKLRSVKFLIDRLISYAPYYKHSFVKNFYCWRQDATAIRIVAIKPENPTRAAWNVAASGSH